MEALLSAARLSLLVSLSATVLIGLAGLGLAYLLASREFRGKHVLDALISVPLVLPPTVVGYYLVLLFGREGWLGAPLYRLTGWSAVFTWQGAALAAFVVALPLMVRVSRAAIQSVDRDLIQISATLGKSEWETAWHVVLPLARQGILAGLLLSFARALGEFGATLMIAGNIPGKTSTLPLSIYTAFQNGDDTLAQTLALLLTVISGAVIYFANRWTASRWM
ncbi:MAG: molybdate ABC transporter permease subunit [Betaproteobacteria bacterium]|nr:molybdate ABC transporter permease subunit [Betaproteobacteria bacterium]MDE2623020.1 molybdate ABC transporter permease subunit [Betaproteobacteria bacterium]